jgi:hypothetical protein
MGKILDLVGKTFTWLKVIKQVENARWGATRWQCECKCGKVVNVIGSNLENGRSKSCGCYKKGHSGLKHGLFNTPEYALWNGARKRAIKKHLPFSIKPADVPKIPLVCPILGIVLKKGVGKPGSIASSPTLDRIVPNKGYVPGNIQVISQRANVIKNDATPEEVMKVAEWMRSINVGRDERKL